jgi:hypothetical protein
MMITTFANTTTNAVIHLKTGKRKYGLLMDEKPGGENYMFIPNESIPFFTETLSNEYIEIVPGTLIEAIETDLK